MFVYTLNHTCEYQAGQAGGGTLYVPLYCATVLYQNKGVTLNSAVVRDRVIILHINITMLDK